MPEAQSPLSHLETGYLVTMRREMSPNPHDGTSYAHVVALLRSLISRELSDPARVEREKAAADKLAAELRQREADALAAKHQAEKDALTLTPEEQAAKAKAELEAKQEREKAELARAHEAAELDKHQAEEAKQFAAHQAQQRAELAAKHAASPPAAPAAEAEGDESTSRRRHR